MVIGRSAELRLINKTTGVLVATHNIPYGSKLYKKNGDKVKKDELICDWDPLNAVIVSEVDGKVAFDNLSDGVTYRVESDEQTGFNEMVIIDSKDKKMIPAIHVVTGSGKNTEIKNYNMPVGAHIAVS